MDSGVFQYALVHLLRDNAIILPASAHLLALLGDMEHMAANRLRASELFEMDNVDLLCGLAGPSCIGHTEKSV